MTLTEELRWIKFIGAKSIEERREVAKGDKLLMEMNDWIDKYLNGYYILKKEAEGKLNILLGMELRFDENINDYLYIL